MKTKKLIRCAAFGELAYTAYLVVWFIISTVHPVKYHFDLLQDICQRSISDILLVSIIIACFALIQSFPKQTTKPFRIFTFCFVALLAISTIIALSHPYFIVYGAHFCFLPLYFSRILLRAMIFYCTIFIHFSQQVRPYVPLKNRLFAGIILS